MRPYAPHFLFLYSVAQYLQRVCVEIVDGKVVMGNEDYCHLVVRCCTMAR